MATWKKQSETVISGGGKTIAYKAFGIEGVWIESRKRAIPHSNRSGVWFYTSYFVCQKDGTEKEYTRQRDAQAAAEALTGGAGRT